MPVMIPPKDRPRTYYGTELVDPIKGIDVTEYDAISLVKEGWTPTVIIADIMESEIKDEE
jgi:hypothetical protein